MTGLSDGWSKWIQFTKKLIVQRSWLWRYRHLGLGSALFFYCISPANAAETVLLQYADRQVTVSLTELKAFVEMGETTSNLQDFIERVPTDQEFSRQLFSDSLPLRFEPSGDSTISRNAQFILYQVNKLVGRPSGDVNYPALRTALIEASRNRGLTLIRLIEAYPEETVRVELRDLERVYSDINLFIERVQPLVQSRQLIKDWLCECAPEEESPTSEATAQVGEKSLSRCQVSHLIESSTDSSSTLPTSSTRLDSTVLSSTASDEFASQPSDSKRLLDLHSPSALANLGGNQRDLSSTPATPPNLETVAPFLLALDWLSQTPPVTPTTSTPTQVAAVPQSSGGRLVFMLGPIGRSIAIADLARFAETGETTRQIRSYLRLANIDAEQVRALLNRRVRVEMQLVDRLLGNVLGEYVLFQASDIIHTRSRQADILAMRSAIILSLQDDNQISPIEFLQRYPTQEVYMDGVALLRAARFVRRTQQNVGAVTNEIGDWLVGVRSAIAEDVCGCEVAPISPEVAP